MIIVVIATAAGIATATFATIACSRRIACKERERQLIRAYLECPQEVEAWLIHGAMEDLERNLSTRIEEMRWMESQHSDRRWSRERSAFSMASSQHQLA